MLAEIDFMLDCLTANSALVKFSWLMHFFIMDFEIVEV